MVLVILGTQDKSFNRLIDEVNKLINNGIIKEEVIVQNGYTKANYKTMKFIDFVDSSKLKDLINDSSYVITHGGVGSILDSLKLNKKVIAVARRAKYNEHSNDHQLQIIKEFSSLGYILDGSEDLESTLKKLKDFKPNKYKSNRDNFVKLISDYIDNN